MSSKPDLAEQTPNPEAPVQIDGVDLSLLAANLRKTPLERIRAHDRALALALELRQAVLRSSTGRNHAAS